MQKHLLLFLSFFLSGCGDSASWNYNRGVSFFQSYRQSLQKKKVDPLFQRRTSQEALKAFSMAGLQNPKLGEAYLSIGTMRNLLAKEALKKGKEKEALDEYFSGITAWRKAYNLLKDKKDFFIFRKQPEKQQEILEKLNLFFKVLDQISTPIASGIYVNTHLILGLIQNQNRVNGLVEYDQALKSLKIKNASAMNLFTSSHFSLPIPSFLTYKKRDFSSLPPSVDHYKKVIKILQKSLQKNPQFKETLLLMGMAHMGLAKEIFLFINKRSPSKARQKLSIQVESNFQKTISCWKKAVQSRFYLVLEKDKKKVEERLTSLLKNWETIQNLEKTEPHSYTFLKNAFVVHGAYLPGMANYLKGSRAYRQKKYSKVRTILQSDLQGKELLGETVYLDFLAHLQEILQEKNKKQKWSRQIKKIRSLLKKTERFLSKGKWRIYSVSSRKKALRFIRILKRKMKRSISRMLKHKKCTLTKNKLLGELFYVTW